MVDFGEKEEGEKGKRRRVVAARGVWREEGGESSLGVENHG